MKFEILAFRTPAVPNLAANFYDIDDSIYGNEVSSLCDLLFNSVILMNVPMLI